MNLYKILLSTLLFWNITTTTGTVEEIIEDFYKSAGTTIEIACIKKGIDWLCVEPIKNYLCCKNHPEENCIDQNSIEEFIYQGTSAQYGEGSSYFIRHDTLNKTLDHAGICASVMKSIGYPLLNPNNWLRHNHVYSRISFVLLSL